MSDPLNWAKANRKKNTPGVPSVHTEPQGRIARSDLNKTTRGGFNPKGVFANELRRGGKRADKVLRKFD